MNNLENKYDDNMDVAFDNLYNWDITFPLYSMTLNNHADIVIKANEKNNMRLTFGELKKQINNRNIAFVGSGHGNHAALHIVDADIREALLGEKNPIQFSTERVEKMIAYKSRDSFKKALDELVATNAEARMLCKMWNDLDIYNMERFKENAMAEKLALYQMTPYEEHERIGTKDWGKTEPHYNVDEHGNKVDNTVYLN